MYQLVKMNFKHPETKIETCYYALIRETEVITRYAKNLFSAPTFNMLNYMGNLSFVEHRLNEYYTGSEVIEIGQNYERLNKKKKELVSKADHCLNQSTKLLNTHDAAKDYRCRVGVRINGVDYSSISGASRELHIARTTIQRAVRNKLETFNSCGKSYSLECDRSSVNHTQKPIEINGVKYKSVSDAGRKLDIRDLSWHIRACRKGISNFTYKGKTYHFKFL